MKRLRTTLLAAALFITGFASAQAFDDGKNMVSLGFGFPATSQISQTLTQYENLQNYNYKNYGTGILKYEHGLAKYFGIGVCVEYSSAFVTYDTNTSHFGQNEATKTTNSQVMGFYARLNGHFPIGDHLDLFGGVDLGYIYTINNSNLASPVANNSTNYKQISLQFNDQITFGARYMIKDHFGLFAEFGWAETSVQMGATIGF